MDRIRRRKRQRPEIYGATAAAESANDGHLIEDGSTYYLTEGGLGFTQSVSFADSTGLTVGHLIARSTALP